MQVQAVAIICLQREDGVEDLDKRVLLVLDPYKPMPHYLKFVGGRMEVGEKPFEAAMRECFEEAELRVRLAEEDAVYDQLRYDHAVRYFQCEADLDKLPRQGDENGNPLIIVTEYRLRDVLSGRIQALPAHVDALRRIKCLSKRVA